MKLNCSKTSAMKCDSFYATDVFLNLLKISENQRISDVFRGHRKGSVAWNGLTDDVKQDVANCYVVNKFLS